MLLGLYFLLFLLNVDLHFIVELLIKCFVEVSMCRVYNNTDEIG